MSRPTTPARSALSDSTNVASQDWWGETLLLADQASSFFNASSSASSSHHPSSTSPDENSNAEDEPSIVHATANLLAAKREARKKEVDEVRERLRALARDLENQKVRGTRPGNVTTVMEHQNALARLDQEHFGFAKQIRDLEGVIASTTAQLARLRDEAKDVDAQDVEQDVEDALDGTVLRSRLYHDLGFLPVPNETDPLDPPTKVLVRSDPTHDARVVKIDKQNDNPYLQANYVWDLVSS